MSFMGRLTERDGEHWSFIACRGCAKPHCTECMEFRKQAAKLAAYENTFLTPEEFECFKEDYNKMCCKGCEKGGGND